MSPLELSQYRGGCIACMDYYKYSADASLSGYYNLVGNFDNISNVLLEKLNQFERYGFDPVNGFAFGFSFGGQLVINAGRDFGGKLSAVDGNKYFVLSIDTNLHKILFILLFTHSL